MEVTVGLPVEWMRGVFEDCGVDLLEAVAEVVWGFRESPTSCDAMLKGSLSVIEGLGSNLRYHPGAAAAKVGAGLSRIFCTASRMCKFGRMVRHCFRCSEHHKSVEDEATV